MHVSSRFHQDFRCFSSELHRFLKNNSGGRHPACDYRQGGSRCPCRGNDRIPGGRGGGGPVYLGEYPEEFTYNGKKYTPMFFAKELGIEPDDYISITSFTHYPFYTQFPIRVPDN